MGIKLDDISEKVTESFIDWDGEKVDFAYFPNYLTPEIEDEMEKADADFVANLMAPCLDWWDVLDADGERIPTTPEQLRKVPSRFLMAIWRKITEEANPPEESS